MADLDLKSGVKAQAINLEELLAYLENRGELGAKEYLFCQARLNESVKQLKKLERLAGANQGG